MQARGVGLRIGRQFWQFIGDDPSTMAEVLEVAGEAASAIEPGATSYSDRVELKLAELVRAFAGQFGERLDEEAWARFLAANS
jgi:hypothetical protein